MQQNNSAKAGVLAPMRHPMSLPRSETIQERLWTSKKAMNRDEFKDFDKHMHS